MTSNNHGGPRKGAGRPSSGKPWRKRISITLTPEVLAHAQQAADTAGTSLSQYIERILLSEQCGEN